MDNNSHSLSIFQQALMQVEENSMVIDHNLLMAFIKEREDSYQRFIERVKQKGPYRSVAMEDEKPNSNGQIS